MSSQAHEAAPPQTEPPISKQKFFGIWFMSGPIPLQMECFDLKVLHLAKIAMAERLMTSNYEALKWSVVKEGFFRPEGNQCGATPKVPPFSFPNIFGI